MVYSCDSTKELGEQCARKWDDMTTSQRKAVNKDISRQAKNNYRQYVDGILLCDIETANAAVNVTEVFKCAKQLSSRGIGKRSVQLIMDEIPSQPPNDNTNYGLISLTTNL